MLLQKAVARHGSGESRGIRSATTIAGSSAIECGRSSIRIYPGVVRRALLVPYRQSRGFLNKGVVGSGKIGSVRARRPEPHLERKLIHVRFGRFCEPSQIATHDATDERCCSPFESRAGPSRTPHLPPPQPFLLLLLLLLLLLFRISLHGVCSNPPFTSTLPDLGPLGVTITGFGPRIPGNERACERMRPAALVPLSAVRQLYQRRSEKIMLRLERFHFPGE